MSFSDVVWRVLEAGVAGYLSLALLITIFQRNLIYKPDARRTTPAVAGHSDVEIWDIATHDREKIVAWYAPAMPGFPTILYFHGNAGWIELRSERLADLSARGFGVLMPSYRGYGGSSGKPSETANIADARTVYDALRDRGVASRDIFVFGESLGTGVATQLAAAKVVAGLILDSPYTSVTELAARKYPWLPVWYLVWDHYETIRHIMRVTEPVLVLHGEADELVPVDMGRSVFEAAISPKALRIYPQTTHLDHIALGSFDDLEKWIKRVRAARRVPVGFKEKARIDARAFTKLKVREV